MKGDDDKRPNSKWRVYTATEGDRIEYYRCNEVLERAGLAREEIDALVLNCDRCLLSNRCPAVISIEFLGARTC